LGRRIATPFRSGKRYLRGTDPDEGAGEILRVWTERTLFAAAEGQSAQKATENEEPEY